MTGRERIENFAVQIDRPFSMAEAADLCGVNIKNAQKYIKDLKDAGRLKVMCKQHNKHVLVFKKPKPSKKRISKNKFKKSIIELYVKIIQENKVWAIRQIAELAGINRQTTFEYIRAMASVGVVGMKKGIYIILDTSKITEIGKKEIKDVLKKLHKENK